MHKYFSRLNYIRIKLTYQLHLLLLSVINAYRKKLLFLIRKYISVHSFFLFYIFPSAIYFFFQERNSGFLFFLDILKKSMTRDHFLSFSIKRYQNGIIIDALSIITQHYKYTQKTLLLCFRKYIPVSLYFLFYNFPV